MENSFINRQVHYWDTLAHEVQDDIAVNHWVDESDKPVNIKMFDEIANYINMKFLQNKSKAYILELGCGNGLILKKLKNLQKDNEWQFYGADISPAMLGRIVDKSFTLYRCDASRIPCEDHLFDLIYLHSVVQYFGCESYLDDVLNECLRILKRGGYMHDGCSPCMV